MMETLALQGVAVDTQERREELEMRLSAFLEQIEESNA